MRPSFHALLTISQTLQKNDGHVTTPNNVIFASESVLRGKGGDCEAVHVEIIDGNIDELSQEIGHSFEQIGCSRFDEKEEFIFLVFRQSYNKDILLVCQHNKSDHDKCMYSTSSCLHRPYSCEFGAVIKCCPEIVGNDVLSIRLCFSSHEILKSFLSQLATEIKTTFTKRKAECHTTDPLKTPDSKRNKLLIVAKKVGSNSYEIDGKRGSTFSSTAQYFVDASDYQHVSDYHFLLLSQVVRSYFSESSRGSHRKVINIVIPGFPGIMCRHCLGRKGAGVYYPSNTKNLQATVSTLAKFPSSFQEKTYSTIPEASYASQTFAEMSLLPNGCKKCSHAIEKHTQRSDW